MDYTNTAKASNVDLKNSAKEHYEQVSNQAGYFNNTIPKAIDFYFEYKDDLILNNRQIEAINDFLEPLHSSIKKLRAVETLDYEDRNWLFGDSKLVSERKQAELEYCERMINEIKSVFNNEMQKLRNISI